MASGELAAFALDEFRPVRLERAEVEANVYSLTFARVVYTRTCCRT